MFSVSQLSDEQKVQIQEWADTGAQLPDIQKKIQQDFGMPITYMDTRFLVLDLGIQLQEEEETVEEEVPEQEETPIPTGEVTATVDDIVRPGALKSGSVCFSDGEKALWIIDEMGRLSLDTTTPGYEANEEDLIKFQEKLRDLLT